MKITATHKTMSADEALAKARGGGNMLGKAMYGKKDITLKLMYLESREVILQLNYRPAPLLRLLGIRPKGPESQKIRMIVEGTRCTGSYAEDAINTVIVDVPDEGCVQNTEYSDEKIYEAARRPALRMVRRQIGRVATAELVSMRSIYRPYYVAFYGELKMGERVRYLPIPADGFRVDRAI